MDSMMKLELKKKLIDELLGELDAEEAMKLKPKEEAKVEMVSVKAEPEEEVLEEKVSGMDEEGKVSSDSEMEDEDLKKLMLSYMGK